MLPLRFPWLWLSLGWALVIGVCVGSLMPGSAVPELGLTDKKIHALSYFLLMVWFSGLYPRARHVRLALVLFGLGLSLDLLQSGTASRTFDLRDIAANGVGILIGLALSFWLLGGWCLRMERRLVSSTAALGQRD
jgi:hypothetical protein